MAQTVSDYLVRRLYDWGVRRIYGYPGDGINGITAALRKVEGTEYHIDFVHSRHEEESAFEACAHAKWTGEIGVCLATSGPGAIHMLNGLYDAKKDHMPVLAIVGQQARQGLGGDFQQEVDLQNLYKDVATAYCQVASVPPQTRLLVDEAMRIAIAEREVAMIAFPNDLQEEEYYEAGRVHGSTFSGIGYSRPRVIPAESDLAHAAEVLNSGEKVSILIGQGARGAAAEVAEIADRLGAGVAKALLGKDVLADDLPWVTGTIGLLGTKPSWDMMMDCDTLLMIGSNFPYSEFLPEEGKARGVQIDIKPKSLGLRYPMEVNLHGDAQETLQALLPLIEHKSDRGWRETIEKNVASWHDLMREREEDEYEYLNPSHLYRQLSTRLPSNAVIAVDCGTSTDWYARHIDIRGEMRATLSGGLATMSPGVPYGVAAKFAFPDRPVICLVGDGAMQMLGNNTLITVKEYVDRWPNKQFVVVVLNNQDLGQVSWEQRVFLGDPRYKTTQQLPDFAYDEFAESLGFRGIRLVKGDDVGAAMDQALAEQRPCVINAYTDRDVPPLPPHVTFDQMYQMTRSLVKGVGYDSTWRQIKNTAKGVADIVTAKLR